jgi:hypothetical protein
MATIAEIRAKYPQYSDMSDAALADALHKKFYADMPRADFDARVGLKAATSPATPPSGIPGPRRERGFFGTIGAPIQAAAEGIISGAGNVMFGAQELLGKGYSALGFTDVGAVVAADAALRRAEAQARVAPFKREFPLATGAGELGAEVLATAPVGSAIAAPVSRFAPALAQAIRTGGFSTGAPVTSRTVNLGTRAAGGAITGGATAAFINPAEAESGALAGGAVALVAPPVVQTLAKSAGFLKDAFTGQLAAIKAGKIARDVAGDRIAAIRAALAAAPSDLTAAQAAAGVQKNAFQALGAFASKTDEMSLRLKQQAADDLARLQQLAEGGNATEARRAYEQSIARLNQLTQDMRNVELGAANQAAQTINRLAPQAQQRQASMVNALRGGIPTTAPLPGQATVSPATEAAQQAATAARGRPGFLSAGDRAQEWQETADIFSSLAKQRRAEAGFLERQIGSLENYGLRPLDAGSITSAIDARLAQPGLRASSNVTRVLQAVKDDLAYLTAQGGGVIDAHDLYTLRKEGINERIMQIMGQTDPKVSAKVTRSVLQEVRPLIDDAIEKAGGTGWRDYLRTYSQNMQAIDQKAMAAEAVRLFKDSPAEYVRLVRGNNPDAVEAIFGPGSYDIFKEMGSKMPTLEKVAAGIERSSVMDDAASKGQKDFAEAVERAGRTFPRLPNPLNPKVTFANMTLDDLEKRLGPKVATKLQEGMMSGKSALEMLNTLPAVERSAVLRMLNNPSTWARGGAALTRAAATTAVPTSTLTPEQKAALEESLDEIFGRRPAAPSNSLAPASRRENALAR